MENWITNFMENFGYLGTFLMILLENVFPPIPSEIVLTFGGFMTTTTELTVFGVVVSATAGSVVGAVILYGIGKLFNVNKLEAIINRFGKILRVKVSDIHKAQEVFNRYGNRAIFFGRMIPLVRSLISIPAGMSNMKLSIFVIYTTFGTLIWNIILVYAGAIFGDKWENILKFMDVYSNITYIVLGIIIVFGVLYFIKNKSK